MVAEAGLGLQHCPHVSPHERTPTSEAIRSATTASSLGGIGILPPDRFQRAGASERLKRPEHANRKLRGRLEQFLGRVAVDLENGIADG